jgi:hypothetical protein
MKKIKPERLKAREPSAVAAVKLSPAFGWYFTDQHITWETSSKRYRTQDEAVSGALAAGFAAVKVDGKIVAKRPKNES